MTNTPQTATVSDEAVQAAFEAYGDRYRSIAAMQDALTAALPHLVLSAAPCSVEVEKLRWHNVDAYCAWCYADTEVGQYRVTWSLNETGQKLHFPDGTTKQFNEKGYGDRDAAKAAAQADFERRILSQIVTKPVDGSMTPEEHRLEDLKQMASYTGSIVSFETRDPYYLASCDCCGWVGSSELCGTDSFGDDSDVYCPRCQASGADSGKVAERISTKPVDVAAVLQGLLSDAMLKDISTEYLSHKGENPWQVKRGGYELWETVAPSMKVAIEYAIRALSPAEPVEQWSDFSNPPKNGRFIATSSGEIERADWRDLGAVITIKAPEEPFACFIGDDGKTFMDEFGELYSNDGRVIDAEDLTAEDNVLRLTRWHPFPAAPTSKGGA